MRTLVTGGAGCIGSDLAEALLNQGHEVIIFDNFSSGKLEHVEPLRSRSSCRVVEADLLDQKAIEAALDGVEMVYHLAANPDVKFVPGDSTDKDLQQNVLATYHLLEAMRTLNVQRLAFTSTSAVYGIAPKLPIGENDFFPQPISLYGATKLACEALISAFAHLFGMRCWVFRLANIVGPKIRKNGRTVISDFIYKLRANPKRLTILGDGTQAKSYLSSNECVTALLFAVRHSDNLLTVLNIGCEDNVSVTRIAEMVVESMGLEGVEFIYTATGGGWPGDVPCFLLDVTAIHRLGWKARYNSEQSVGQAIRATLEALS